MDENKTMLTLGYEDGNEVQIDIIERGKSYERSLELEDLMGLALDGTSQDECPTCNWAVRADREGIQCRTFGWLDEDQARRMFEIMGLPALLIPEGK